MRNAFLAILQERQHAKRIWRQRLRHGNYRVDMVGIGHLTRKDPPPGNDELDIGVLVAYVREKDLADILAVRRGDCIDA